ncbi:putative secreted protein [Xanthomonas euvesicatoria pv. vesicatoria str. 85-10]|uniref:Putative secreted protein n=1 Tax=Xanthomonas euvesicatoria pv. vesicatoria (strain 85-10) TaxID=316273 RepID=Q3BMF1_XANE5|nr:putative secreted protein [Xanthomonas euvesicatoria pv. vesicatoria str. 85-10]
MTVCIATVGQLSLQRPAMAANVMRDHQKRERTPAMPVCCMQACEATTSGLRHAGV